MLGEGAGTAIANKNPEVLLTCFSQPEVRFRPLPTCDRRILAYAAYDLNLGSGLASNRKNLPTPRDPIFAFGASCFLNQRFAIDRRCPSACLCAAGAATVNLLRPQTRHQPGNLRICQRTIVFYSLCEKCQRNLRICICFVFNLVQLVHRHMTGNGAERWAAGPHALQALERPSLS